MKQVKLRDIENDVVFGGILLDDGNIVCACCGGLIEKDTVTLQYFEGSNKSDILTSYYGNNIEDDAIFALLDVYDTWVDFSETILE